MQTKRNWHRLLTGCAFVAIVYLFFLQVRIVKHPIPIAVNTPSIAYGYSNVTYSGTVYTDEGETTFQAGSGIAIHVNGVAASTTNTDSSGDYSFTGLEIDPSDVVTVFINNEEEIGALVTKHNVAELSDLSVTGMDIYMNRLIVRTTTTDLNVTTTNLNTANNASDSDVDAVYTLANSNTDLKMGHGNEFYVWSSTTHTASGSIFTHDLDVRGTLTMASGEDITASGSFVVPGNITTTGDVYLTSYESGELLQVNGSALNNVYIDSGLESYWRFDEGRGTTVAGSSFAAQTGATLTGGARFAPSVNTGITLFYNPLAIELDGTDDYLEFSDAFDLTTDTRRTFAGWFKRDTSNTDDALFTKKSAEGSGSPGYMLFYDADADTLIFELADGTNTYTVTSDSTITDTNWHHVAVAFNALDNDETNIFIDGAIDVASKTGSLNPSSDSVQNAITFKIGDDDGANAPFDGIVDDFRIYKRVLSGSELSVLAAGNKTTGSGTYKLSADLDVDGDLGIYGGTLDVGTGYSINIEGDLTAYGLLRTNSGTVTLDGDSQELAGSTAFQQLAKSKTSIVTLTFESGTEQTVSGALTINGATNNRLRIRASVTGSQSYLILEDSGATVLKHLDVRDSNGDSGATLYCTLGCINSTNNVNWVFEGDCGDGVINTGEQCDDGDSDNNDDCPNDCQLAVCGDTVLEGREECEPPNVGNCLSNCLFRGGGGGVAGFSSASSAGSFFNRPDPPNGCGNAILEVDKGEECDSGTRFNGLGTCSFDCKLLVCGDGIISPQIGEDCEPTIAGTVDGVTTFEVGTCGEVCTAPEMTHQGTTHGGCRRMFFPACDGASSSSVPTQSGPPRCGNGIVDVTEECDFGGICEGGDFDGSFWTDRTSANTCIAGGGVPQPESGDGCDDACKTEFCGDGSVQQRGADNQPNTADDEECDNGSVCSNDPSIACRLDTDCGTGNTCEYHATKDQTCSSSCKSTGQAQSSSEAVRPSAPQPVCGNGETEGSEECDEGAENGSQESTCTVLCTERVFTPAPVAEPFCGNAIIDGQEQCDNGDANSDMQPDACRTNCVVAVCGDFVVDGNEQCDNGDGNSDVFSDTCRTNCRLPSCGDGILDSDEQCDGSLSCRPDCTLAMSGGVCGNGIIDSGEQCDDGNRDSDDGCSTFCQIEQVQPSPPVCGNGVIETGEQCDDGNTESSDACSNQCKIIEIESRRVAAAEFRLDADVIIVNPTEIANAIKFLDTIDPCSTLVVKGQNQKATSIRGAALENDIPIVRNIELARTIFSSVNPGQVIFGEYCDEINEIKAQVLGTPKPSAPKPPIPIQPKPQTFPQNPTQFAYGYYPYAQLSPMIAQTAPIGDTGPGLIGIGVTGAAAGMGWIRKQRKRYNKGLKSN